MQVCLVCAWHTPGADVDDDGDDDDNDDDVVDVDVWAENRLLIGACNGCAAVVAALQSNLADAMVAARACAALKSLAFNNPENQAQVSHHGRAVVVLGGRN